KISKIDYQEKAFLEAMKLYLEHTKGSNITNDGIHENYMRRAEESLNNTDDKIPEKYMNHREETSNNDCDEGFENSKTSLKLLPKFYNWVLKTFGADAEITRFCFDDILKTRISIDRQLAQEPNAEIPDGWTKCSYEAALNIWKLYCEGGVPFQQRHVLRLSQATHEDILRPLFKRFLPKLFKMKIIDYMEIEDPNIPFSNATNNQNVEGQNEETKGNITSPINCNYSSPPSKQDYRASESEVFDSMSEAWFGLLANLKDHLMVSNDRSLGTKEFRQHLETFMDELDESQFKNGKRNQIDSTIKQARKKLRNNAIL
ncbi:1040_t:CDS:1, partial [Acaulospora colombiana]